MVLGKKEPMVSLFHYRVGTEWQRLHSAVQGDRADLQKDQVPYQATEPRHTSNAPFISFREGTQ